MVVDVADYLRRLPEHVLAVVYVYISLVELLYSRCFKFDIILARAKSGKWHFDAGQSATQGA